MISLGTPWGAYLASKRTENWVWGSYHQIRESIWRESFTDWLSQRKDDEDSRIEEMKRRNNP